MRKRNLILLAAFLTLTLIFSSSTIAASPPARVNKEVPVFARDVELAQKVQIKGGKASAKPPKTSSSAATGVLGAPVGGEKYAIVIGISDYPGTASDLQYCDDDARDMVDALEGYGFSSDNIITLTDGAATRAAIIDAIRYVAAQAGADDEVVFFFSGHGGRGKADDFDKEAIDECIWSHDGSSFIPIWDGELAAEFSAYDTNRIVFIFDSCYAGGMTDLKGAGRIVAMATTENTLSAEYTALENGEFTYYMIDQGMIACLADRYDSMAGVPDVTIEESWDYARLNCKYDSLTISDSFTNDLLP